MFYHFCTHTERAKTLHAVKEGNLPTEFVELYPKEAAVVKWLIATDPKQRPTAAEILSSPLLKRNDTVEELQQQLEESREVIKQQAEYIRVLEEQLRRLQIKEVQLAEVVEGVNGEL